MRIGVLVPFTNTVLERDLERLRPKGAATYVTRIGGYGTDDLPDARAMQRMGDADIDHALALIGAIEPDAVMYGCTSATMAHGLDHDRQLRERIQAATGALAITAGGALIRSLRSLGAERIAFVSPYTRDLADQSIAFFAAAGFETAASAVPVGPVLARDQGAMTPQDIAELAARAASPRADAFVLACTDLRAVEAAPAIESAHDRPVVAVNRAMFDELAVSRG